MSDTIHGTASRDIATVCGRGIAKGERVRIIPRADGRFDVQAAGGRRAPRLTCAQVAERTDT